MATIGELIQFGFSKIRKPEWGVDTYLELYLVAGYAAPLALRYEGSGQPSQVRLLSMADDRDWEPWTPPIQPLEW